MADNTLTHGKDDSSSFASILDNQSSENQTEEAAETPTEVGCLSAKKRTSSKMDSSDAIYSGKKSRKEQNDNLLHPALSEAEAEPDPVTDSDEELQEIILSISKRTSTIETAQNLEHRRWSFASDLGRNLPSLVHRCKVHRITVQPISLILTLKKLSTNERIVAILSGPWSRTEAKQGDIVNVICALSKQDGKSFARIDSHEGFLILHPDTLIAGSTLPLGNDCVRKGYLRHWMTEHGPTNHKAVFGNIMHKLMQAALNKYVPYNGKELALNQELNDSIESSRDELFECGKTEEEVQTYVRESLPLLRSWLEAYASPSSEETIRVHKVLDVEEAIYAPQFGLKGRIDATLSVQLNRDSTRRMSIQSQESHHSVSRRSSLSLKSPHHTSKFYPTGPLSTTALQGTQLRALSESIICPMEFKTGKEWFTHHAQVMLYFLLLETRYNEEIEEGLLWYLGPPMDTKVVRLKKLEMDSILQARNHFASYIREIETTLPPMLHNTRVCQRCPFLTDCTILHKALEGGDAASSGIGELFQLATEHVKVEYSDFLRKWISACDWEDAQSKRKEPLMWNPDREACKQAGSTTMWDLKLHNVRPNQNGWLYTFKGANDRELLSFDEFVFLSIQDWQVGILKGFIRQRAKDFISVFSDTLLAERWQEKKHKWRIDRFYSTKLTSVQRTNLLELVGSKDEAISTLRELIIEKRKPENLQECANALNPNLKALTTDLNSDQTAACKRIWQYYEYSLVWGMPGAGKTHTTVQAIQGLIKQNRSILISSYTHSAVDNILTKLKKVQIPFLRLGSKSHVHESVHDHLIGSSKYPNTSISALRKLMEEIQVVGVTCSSAKHPLLASKKFDVCIVDEASQISLPTLLGPLLKAKSFILVGDPKQLPPLVKTEEAKQSGMDETLFSVLQKANPEAVVHLRLQYRMCEKINALANHLVYDDHLLCGNHMVSSQQLQLPHYSDAAVCSGHEWCHEILNPDNPIVMVDTSSQQFYDQLEGDSYINAKESNLVLELISALLDFGLSRESIGVISPYNGQIRHIQSQLEDQEQCKYPKQSIEVSTVDKFQGRDKDCIIMSFVRSNPENETGALLADWRRINVAITRARMKLLLLGDTHTLQPDPFLHSMITYFQSQNYIRSLQGIKVRRANNNAQT